MEEYIKRSDVINNIECLKKSPWYNDDNGFGSRIIKKDAVYIVTDLCVKNVPVVDVREVVHAKWIKMHGNLSMFFKCSKCGACNEFGTRYCPDCGAKMDLK